MENELFKKEKKKRGGIPDQTTVMLCFEPCAQRSRVQEEAMMRRFTRYRWSTTTKSCAPSPAKGATALQRIVPPCGANRVRERGKQVRCGTTFLSSRSILFPFERMEKKPSHTSVRRAFGPLSG